MVKLYHSSFFYFFVIFLLSVSLSHANPNRTNIYTDIVYVNSKSEVIQDLYYQSDTTAKFDLSISCYQYRKNDSTLLYTIRKQILLKKGIKKIKITFSDKDTTTSILEDFKTVLVKIKHVPPGIYKTYLKYGCDEKIIHKELVKNIDSLVSNNSALADRIDASGKSVKKNIFGIEIKQINKSKEGGIQSIRRYNGKVQHNLKKKGIISIEYVKEESKVVDLYFNSWFIGRYISSDKNILKERLQKEKNIGEETFNNTAKNNLTDYTTIFSQLKKYNQQKTKNKYVKGEISLSLNGSNGQEENSLVNNNYYEVGGNISIPIAGLPFVIDGMYTSQDIGRKIKSSYIKISYDAMKAKEELQESIKGYNSKFSETLSKARSLEDVYETFLKRLKENKQVLLKELNKELVSIDKLDIKVDTNKLLLDKNLQNKYQNKLEKLREINDKIDKYEKLLDQYKQAKFFDSSIVYDNLKNVTKGNELSYKQLSKQAKELIPDNTPKIQSGLTNMELGILQKSMSKYTIDGQTVKGGTIGYDFSFVQSNLLVGNIEYISRNGDIERYTGYAYHNTFVPYSNQQVGLVYFGYTPSKKMFDDNQFLSQKDIFLPGFKRPYNIIALTYSGEISKYIRAGGELATSFRKNDHENSEKQLSKDKTSYFLSVEGSIPNTSILLDAMYESVGKDFDNNTLPILLNGTEKINIGGRSDLFRSFLTVGIQYNHLKQVNFTSIGKNTKWGFDIRTNSRRYPSLYLSYKPFSTFRSFDDTLQVPQRPILGEVWIAKTMYQFKKNGYIIRTQGTYARNSTTMDTLRSGNELIQINIMCTKEKVTCFVSAAISTSLSDIKISSLHQNLKLVSGGANWGVENITFSLGKEFGFSQNSLVRDATNGGIGYQFKKIPLRTRSSVRYSSYMLSGSGRKKIASANIDITYQFNYKIKNLEK